MRSIAISIILLGYFITISKCVPAYESSNAVDFDGLTSSDVEKDNMIKRMERRAYTYMTGIPGSKRLPNYNFGLGKRARPYRFGLGKRSGDSDYDDLTFLAEQENSRPWFERGSRSRYNMGLGKRIPSKDDVERRSPPERLYGFGLGKRAADNDEDSSTPLPVESQAYDAYDRLAGSRGSLSVDFGKRFLREDGIERRSGPQRYNFGLGR